MADIDDDADEPASGRSRLRGFVLRGALVGFGALLIVQLVPYGWQHPNPPVRRDAPWPTAASADLARRACYDCHSNETEWPWYSYVAPQSWLVRQDVEAGRDEFNFSDWGEDGGEADDAIERIEDGSMPPTRYTLLHGDADLSDAEQQELIAALRQMEEADDGGSDNSGPGNGDDGDGGDNSGSGNAEDRDAD